MEHVYMQGRSVKQASLCLGVTERAVRSLLDRGRNCFKLLMLRSSMF
jgi:DNA-directed RNA polymerase specialized sigma24 family protein